MNKIVTLNALRGNSYSLFRKIPLMINMGVCAFCLVPAMVFAENTHEVTVLNAQQQNEKQSVSLRTKRARLLSVLT